MDLHERFFRDAKKTSASKDGSIHRSYRHFLDFFKSKRTLTEQDFVIGCFFTYGWMPTILDLRGDWNKALSILNRVKAKGEKPTNSEIQIIASNINGSIVGTTKLMHFIRPDIHAIWDSRVYRYLHQEPPHSYRIEKLESYTEYLDQIRKLANDSRFSAVRNRIKNEIGYDVTDNRIVEFIMYQNGEKPKFK